MSLVADCERYIWVLKNAGRIPSADSELGSMKRKVVINKMLFIIRI